MNKKEKDIKFLRDMDNELLDSIRNRNNPYAPKIHFNNNGIPKCGTKIRTKTNQRWRLTEEKGKVTCRHCLNGNIISQSTQKEKQ